MMSRLSCQIVSRKKFFSGQRDFVWVDLRPYTKERNDNIPSRIKVLDNVSDYYKTKILTDTM